MVGTASGGAGLPGTPNPRGAAEVDLTLSERLSTVLEATADLNAMLTDTRALYASLLGRLSRAVPFNSGSIQVMEGGEARIVAFLGGMDPEIVMKLRFPMDPLYPNFRVVSQRCPVAFDDIRVEYPHFSTRQSEFASGHIRSWLGVPMLLAGEVIGMIALDRNVVEPFHPEDIRVVQGFANNAAVAIQNSAIYAKLEEALAIKDRLMKELHHRVKNNLQMISSFISIHAGLVEGQGNQQILEELSRRIGSISTAHDHLYRLADQESSVDLGLFLRNVCDDFEDSFIGIGSKVSVRTDFEEISADISLRKGDPSVSQEPLGCVAVRSGWLRVDDDPRWWARACVVSHVYPLWLHTAYCTPAGEL